MIPGTMVTRVLDRYVMREIAGPLGLGLMVFTMILLTDVLFDLAEMIIQRDVALGVVAELLLLSLPHIVVLTIPMSFLFAVLITVGRLSADSELVAIRSAGISLFALYRPVMAWAGLLTALNIWLMLTVLPWGNTRSQALQREVISNNVVGQVTPGRFYDELDGTVLYVDRTAGERWTGVFVGDSILGRQSRITFARSGTVDVNEAASEVVLTLQDGTVHELDLGAQHRYSIETFATSTLVESDGTLALRAQHAQTRSLRAMTFSELVRFHADESNPENMRSLAMVNVHKKFSIPAACIVLGLFGVPLGFDNRRGGRSSGFALSLVVILIYQVLITAGERTAERGDLAPWLAMWLPNILFLIAGLFLLTRRNSDKSLILSRLDQWIRDQFWSHARVRSRYRQRRKYQKRESRQLRRSEKRERQSDRAVGDAGRAAAPRRRSLLAPPARRDADLRLRFQLPSLRFPNVLDRYLLRLFTRVFVLAALAGMLVFVIANFTELVDEVLENDVSTETILQYYKFLSFDIFNLLAPVVILISTLVSFGLLSRSNEVIAAKASGISLYRLAIPVVLAALLVAGLCALLESSVLPYSNARAADYKSIIRGTQDTRTFKRADQQWLYGRGGYLYHFQFFDEESATLQHLHVFQLDLARLTLTGRLYAETAAYDGRQWQVRGGWLRRFDGSVVTDVRELVGPVPVDLPETPEFFDTELKPPEEMGPEELAHFIDRLENAGQETTQYRVQLHSKLAGPGAALVMAFVALPFAFRLGRRGALYGIGIALAIGMIYFALNAFFVTLGDAGALPPLIAVWAPNVLFSTASLYLFLGVQT
ncbi:MAG: LPS export ABC transporter permease LptF [Acidobacteria bacterium]|nr:MAG: LPS export ABC transporter permease LptF [Acidobacteriota bacterium]REK10371.1 MAG: LPS export ABC transporter permease LptF [Acidobacteriota bacterium]